MKIHVTPVDTVCPRSSDPFHILSDQSLMTVITPLCAGSIAIPCNRLCVLPVCQPHRRPLHRRRRFPHPRRQEGENGQNLNIYSYLSLAELCQVD